MSALNFLIVSLLPFLSSAAASSTFRRYIHGAPLDDNQATLFWNLSDHHSLSIAARSERQSGYLSIGFAGAGGGMVNTVAFVGWIDGSGRCRVSSYRIDGRDPSNLHPIAGGIINLTVPSCGSDVGGGTFFFEISLPIDGEVIDPAAPASVVWAIGRRWSEDHLLSWDNMHSSMSDRAVTIRFTDGSVEAPPPPMLGFSLALHGLLMFAAWGVLLPAGVSARASIHLRLQCSGAAVSIVGLATAVVALGGFVAGSGHAKLGLSAMALLCAQAVGGFLRKRTVWEWVHAGTGKLALIAGAAAMVSGASRFGRRYDSEAAERIAWLLILWVMIVVFVFVYLEFLEVKRRGFCLDDDFASRAASGGRCGLAGEEDDDGKDGLLSLKEASFDIDGASPGRVKPAMEQKA